MLENLQVAPTRLDGGYIPLKLPELALDGNILADNQLVQLTSGAQQAPRDNTIDKTCHRDSFALPSRRQIASRLVS
jgi:hypothetical protein